MWAITGIVAIGVIIMFIEVPFLVKNKHRDLWVFSVLLLLGIMLNILEQVEVSIPNPFEGLTIIFQPYSEVISGIFK